MYSVLLICSVGLSILLIIIFSWMLKMSLSSGDVQKILVFRMKENTRFCTNVKKLAYEYTDINIYTYYI